MSASESDDAALSRWGVQVAPMALREG